MQWKWQMAMKGVKKICVIIFLSGTQLLTDLFETEEMYDYRK